LAEKKYCPKCLSTGDPEAEFCTACGEKLVPLMRIVIMPFVVSGPEREIWEEYRELVERDGEIRPDLAVGCQLYMQSGMEKVRLMVSQKEHYLAQAERTLPLLVKSYLDPMLFYDVPDPVEVFRVAEEAVEMPTELFVIIQNQYDPEYLFLPEIDFFFFRYPRLHTSGTDADSGFGYVQLSAFLLDNRENRIVSRGSGAGLEYFEAAGAVLDENFSIPTQDQLEVMYRAASQAVERMLRNMKMIK